MGDSRKAAADHMEEQQVFGHPRPNQTYQPQAIQPNYYKVKIKGVEIDAIDIIKAFGMSFCVGNAFKYIARAGEKGPKDIDIKKAIECLKREIDEGTH